MTVGKAVQCKVCEKFAWLLSDDKPPSRWIILTVTESTCHSSGSDFVSGYQTVNHFCSGKCARKHIEKWA